MKQAPANIADAKQQAKDLRAQMASQGTEISHSNALELIAQQNGFRDWNTYYSALEKGLPANWVPGGRVQGYYMSQAFEAQFVNVKMLRPGWFHVELNLDDPVDVVTFDGFSNFRKRIRGIVGPEGFSHERSSNGIPHLQLKLSYVPIDQ